jgi:hypothetical protein
MAFKLGFVMIALITAVGLYDMTRLEAGRGEMFRRNRRNKERGKQPSQAHPLIVSEKSLPGASLISPATGPVSVFSALLSLQRISKTLTFTVSMIVSLALR